MIQELKNTIAGAAIDGFTIFNFKTIKMDGGDYYDRRGYSYEFDMKHPGGIDHCDGGIFVNSNTKTGAEMTAAYKIKELIKSMRN